VLFAAIVYKDRVKQDLSYFGASKIFTSLLIHLPTYLQPRDQMGLKQGGVPVENVGSFTTCFHGLAGFLPPGGKNRGGTIFTRTGPYGPT